MAWGVTPWGRFGWGAFGPPPIPSPPAIPPPPAKELRRLFGRDIFFNGDYAVTAAGDWAIVEGEEALKQSVIRRIITSPGEWRTRPTYGAGARDFVKQKRTAGRVDELRNAIRSQLLQDIRIEAVEAVDLDTTTAEVLRISVKFKASGRQFRGRSIVAKVEVT